MVFTPLISRLRRQLPPEGEAFITLYVSSEITCTDMPSEITCTDNPYWLPLGGGSCQRS